MSVQLDAAFNYNDLNGLQSLKKGARDDDPEALMAVAQQFESMFMSLLMKSMREATDVLASDLENSYQTKFYRDMHDQQLALSVSQMGGFGLADVLYEQLAPDADRRFLDGQTPAVKPLEQSNRSILPVLNGHIPAPESRTQPETKTSGELPPFSQSDSVDSTSIAYSSPAEFIESLTPAAEAAAAQLGVDAKYLLAQAALETGWGRAMIQTEQGQSANNFFGIKADQRWQGDTANTTTTEFIAGRPMTVTAPFRAYSSPADSFADYVDFLSSSERYQPALAVVDQPEQYVQALQQAGYATDPAYAEKIIRIAHSEWFDES